MPEAMAPASADSEGIGSMMPKSMRSGGEVERYAEGGLLEGIAESVSRNQEMLGTVAQNMGKMNSNIMQPRPAMPIQQPFNPIMTDMEYRRPFNGFGGSPFNTDQIERIRQPLGFGGKGPQRPGRKTYGRPATISGLGAFADIFNKKSPAVEPQAMAEGGVIRAQDGLPEEESYLSQFGSSILNFLQPEKEVIEGRIQESNPLGIGPVLSSPSTDATLDDLEEKEKEKKLEPKKEEETITGTIQDNIAREDTSTAKPLTLEEELVKRQAGLDKDRNFDKYMALAQAGLGILASDKPTLAGAIGEGGMKGLDAFNAANKRYEEGLNDILNARVKLKSAKKSGLTQKDAISAINGIDANIARLEKGSETFQYDDAKMKEIRGKIAQLESQKETLLSQAGFSRLSRNVSDSANTKS